MTTSTATRRGLAALALALGATILGAVPAWAHPGLRPAEVAAGESTELELVIEHDCDPRDGEPSPTTLVAIQVPEELAAAAALPVEGWRTSAETDDAGRTTVIEWAVEEGAQPETPPTLPLRVTADSTTETTEIGLVVLQECSTGSYLWGGGDEDEPAVRLTVTPGTHTPPSPSPSPSTEEASPAVTPSASDPSDPPDDGGSDRAEGDQGQGGTVWWVVVALLLAASAVAAVTLRRRRGGR